MNDLYKMLFNLPVDTIYVGHEGEGSDITLSLPTDDEGDDICLADITPDGEVQFYEHGLKLVWDLDKELKDAKKREKMTDTEKIREKLSSNGY